MLRWEVGKINLTREMCEIVTGPVVSESDRENDAHNKGVSYGFLNVVMRLECMREGVEN